ncbi:hypothetical protein ABEB36_000184 [Hypothenemus hampei]|uniref:Transposable element P transposase-like RNase H domain-containing protein n=1 Tax=Hypothenemus hampei TaxID=57062 RepID=A0ABD1FAH8_HYPHA
MFDEMSLATHINYLIKQDEVEGFATQNTSGHAFANHAQVFMVRGITQRWKQPIFYHFSGGPVSGFDIAITLKSIILKLTDIGLTVCTVICDQGANNCTGLKYLCHQTKIEKLQKGEETENDFFFEIGGQKIFPLYDPPHLLKCIRNNFLNHNIVYYEEGKKKVAKWDHIITAYNMDPYFGSLRLMPKLTDQHVLKTKFAK